MEPKPEKSVNPVPAANLAQNQNIDPKIEAMNIVSEIEKKQKSNLSTPKKRGLGPAETGSLLKHKELQKNKFTTKTQPATVSNYVDFDSSDSSLGSFEGTKHKRNFDREFLVKILIFIENKIFDRKLNF